MPARLANSSSAAPRAAILFPVSEKRSIDLGPEALEALCATAARAVRQDAGTTIRVDLEEHESFMAEIARLDHGGTEAQRQWAMDSLVPELARFAAEIDYLEKGIGLLFSPDTLPLGFPDGLSNDQLVTALQAFVRYEWDRNSGNWKPALELDLYSDDRPRLSARVRLDGDERVAFLKRQGLPPDVRLGRLQLLDLGFRDLGPDLALKRALPAVLSTLASHARSLEKRGETFDLDNLPSVVGWSVGLA